MKKKKYTKKVSYLKRILLSFFTLPLVFVVGFLLYFQFAHSPFSSSIYKQNPSSPITPTLQQQMYGVNMSGGEFGQSHLPGVLFTDYIYPHDTADYQYFESKNIQLIRLPILWERVQPSVFGDLSITDTDEIEKVFQTANAHHMRVILDLHNFGSYYNTPLTIADADKLADVWMKLAAKFGNEPGLYGYELMNEPHDLPGGEKAWVQIAQTVTTAIRTIDQSSVILIPGYDWQNSQNWSNNNPDLHINDSSNNLIYSAHIYFDSTYQGTYKKAFAADDRNIQQGETYSQDFRNWLAENNAKGMFTEFGVPDDDPQWLTTMDTFLQSISQDPNIIGAIYWSAGPWWGDYPLSIEPQNGKDQPQMQVLQKYSLAH